MAPEMLGVLATRRRRHACCPALQREYTPQTLTRVGTTARSRVPQPDVQVSGGQLLKHHSERLTVQPTPGRPVPYGQSRSKAG